MGRYQDEFIKQSCNKDAIVITNTTAPPMPAAVSVFLETPRKEQIPRN